MDDSLTRYINIELYYIFIRLYDIVIDMLYSY